jgi:hypothetical protein
MGLPARSPASREQQPRRVAAPWADEGPPGDGWDGPAVPEPEVVFEKSGAIDLVARRPEPLEPRATAKQPKLRRRPAASEKKELFLEKSLSATGAPRRRWMPWWALLIVLALAGGSGGVYEFRGRIPWHRLQSWVGSTVARGRAVAGAFAHRIDRRW